MKYLVTLLLLASCGSEGPQGVPGPAGAQGDAGESGSAGSAGTSAAASSIVIALNDCKKVDNNYIKRTATDQVRVHSSADQTCTATSLTTLDTDDEVYWLDSDTMIVLNPGGTLYVLQF